MTPVSRAAFFDVDETLVAQKTMFGFLRFHLAAAGRPPADYEGAYRAIQALKDRGATREEANRAYYTLYAGASAAELAAQGRAWYLEQRRAGGFYHGPGTQALRRHQESGDATVLVSGSFFPCLDPVAEHLGATAVLGTPVVVREGRLTGEVRRPMIGAAKAEAAAAWAAARGIDLAGCHAYGDHSSDLELLRAVGHPVAVGADPVLRAHVARAGGRTLPGLDASAARHGRR
ncbi:HAD-superfamily subfamily IB hydrolase, TIGR01490 [Actinacidiphila rubida]|uniref:HAD-superfamily subfamily IB hydrolase, TIGR01490 n=1 Tax=Actinacidiphila rubida TaxID=310780 RepID=A0A1H8KCF1_9ACTN|nr:HAD-IB family hydrolase [Actinacidiphila rubida]SEN90176.1 HAD-superfamily subfamily IB hydrolase, TIGR01490 [Actinacidiphila rubida]